MRASAAGRHRSRCTSSAHGLRPGLRRGRGPRAVCHRPRRRPLRRRRPGGTARPRHMRPRHRRARALRRGAGWRRGRRGCGRGGAQLRGCVRRAGRWRRSPLVAEGRARVPPVAVAARVRFDWIRVVSANCGTGFDQLQGSWGSRAPSCPLSCMGVFLGFGCLCMARLQSGTPPVPHCVHGVRCNLQDVRSISFILGHAPFVGTAQVGLRPRGIGVLATTIGRRCSVGFEPGGFG